MEHPRGFVGLTHTEHTASLRQALLTSPKPRGRDILVRDETMRLVALGATQSLDDKTNDRCWRAPAT